MRAMWDDFTQSGPVRPWGLTCPWGDDGARVEQEVLLFDAQSGNNRAYPTCVSTFAASLRSDALSIEFMAVPALPDTAVYFGLQDRSPQHDLWIEMALQGGNLRAMASAELGPLPASAVTFDPVAHRLWRWREESGVLVAETSPGGDPWTELVRLPAPDLVDHAHLHLGLSPAEGQSDGIIVDNLNTDRTAGSWCPASSVHDDFEASELDPRWRLYPEDLASCQGGIVDGQAVLTLRPGSGPQCDLYRVEGYRIRDSEVLVEFPERPPINHRLGIELWGTQGYFVTWALGRDSVVAEVAQQFGAAIFGPIETPDIDTRWLRLRQQGEQLLFERRSAAGASWTTQHSVPVSPAVPLDPLSVALQITRVTGSTPASGVTLRADNLNLP
ncbi:MAG: hypothetical protein ABIJ09_09065 [Pseudomonadota bacterium]